MSSYCLCDTKASVCFPLGFRNQIQPGKAPADTFLKTEVGQLIFKYQVLRLTMHIYGPSSFASALARWHPHLQESSVPFRCSWTATAKLMHCQ